MMENPKKGRTRGQGRMLELGYKAMTVYLKKSHSSALGLYCNQNKVRKGELVRQLIERLLREKGLIE
jgi:hypothetical protein